MSGSKIARAIELSPFMRALRGEVVHPTPVWLMRQAGRYLPEYRELRATSPSFLDFCFSPEKACEATLQPIRRFGFDAAILFSDILVVPEALGQKVSFETGAGPQLEKLDFLSAKLPLRETIDFRKLQPVFETVSLLRSSLPVGTPLIGFCGAPWTVASYMIGGKGSPDHADARLFAYRHPDIFQNLIDLLTRSSIEYLKRQTAAGADVLQIFDSWAGLLPRGEFERWCLAPLQAMVDA